MDRWFSHEVNVHNKGVAAPADENACEEKMKSSNKRSIPVVFRSQGYRPSLSLRLRQTLANRPVGFTMQARPCQEKTWAGENETEKFPEHSKTRRQP